MAAMNLLLEALDSDLDLPADVARAALDAPTCAGQASRAQLASHPNAPATAVTYTPADIHHALTRPNATAHSRARVLASISRDTLASYLHLYPDAHPDAFTAAVAGHRGRPMTQLVAYRVATHPAAPVHAREAALRRAVSFSRPPGDGAPIDQLVTASTVLPHLLPELATLARSHVPHGARLNHPQHTLADALQRWADLAAAGYDVREERLNALATGALSTGTLHAYERAIRVGADARAATYGLDRLSGLQLGQLSAKIREAPWLHGSDAYVRACQIRLAQSGEGLAHRVYATLSAEQLMSLPADTPYPAAAAAALTHPGLTVDDLDHLMSHLEAFRAAKDVEDLSRWSFFFATASVGLHPAAAERHTRWAQAMASLAVEANTLPHGTLAALRNFAAFGARLQRTTDAAAAGCAMPARLWKADAHLPAGARPVLVNAINAALRTYPMSAAYVGAVLALAPTMSGTLGELLDVAAGIAQ